MTVFRELSQHILDIFENGAKAGASLVFLNIVEDLEQDRLSISISDNGCGMDEATVRHVSDPWVTSRTTRKVGLGIPFLKQTAEMCGGAFEIRSELGKGTVTVATFEHSHIDRPPLGDLVATIVCMVVGYPGVDIVYRHTVGKQAFDLDTREIREVLGADIPFSDPDVLGFLRSMLEEGLGALKGEPLPGVP